MFFPILASGVSAPLAPIITSIVPNHAFAGTATPVLISGMHFDELYLGGDAHIVITGSGLVASNVVVVSSVAITATFTADVGITHVFGVQVITDQGISNLMTFAVSVPTPTPTPATCTPFRRDAVPVLSGSRRSLRPIDCQNELV